MHVDEAVRSAARSSNSPTSPWRSDPVCELLELAVLAPNHHETEPWRFWVVGRETLQALTDATGDKKLLRSHTAIVVGVKLDSDAQTAEEDYAAVSCAIQNIMLAARGRGLASSGARPACSLGRSWRRSSTSRRRCA